MTESEINERVGRVLAEVSMTEEFNNMCAEIKKNFDEKTVELIGKTLSTAWCLGYVTALNDSGMKQQNT